MKQLNTIQPKTSRLVKHKENIYNKVNNEKRILLLKMVKEQGKSLKEASKILDINYSTAKTILRVFRLEKRILKKTALLCNIEGNEQQEHIEKCLAEDSLSSFQTTFSYQYQPHQQPHYFCFEELNNIAVFTQKCIEQVMTNELILNSIQDKLNAFRFLSHNQIK